MISITLCVDRDDEELELQVFGTVSPFVPARTSGPPDNWCPSEGGDVEVCEIRLNGEPWEDELSEAESDRAEEMLREAAADEAEGRLEAYAESRAEAAEEAREERWDD